MSEIQIPAGSVVPNSVILNRLPPRIRALVESKITQTAKMEKKQVKPPIIVSSTPSPIPEPEPEPEPEPAA